ncbi:MAG: endonuclease III [Chitinophagales bacterium]|jgi:endonuclease-3|nr:endonuclease III [Bacteroidota bacterium]MBP9878609.1 endonuclease III [Chitinophagales bacterium]
MTKKQKAEFVQATLNKLYPNPDIPLQHKDPYTLLIAVVLSAQCTDERVNKITPKLFALADNPHDMIKLSVETIKEIILPCGLSPMKSKGIFGLSKILVEQYDGKVPASFEALEALPSVGHKTASVVMTQAFGVPAFPVDTHIHRLAWRWTLSNGKSVEQTERDLKRLFPEASWNLLHLQIIYFGRAYCPARGHDPTKCPICSVIGRKNQ